MPSIKTELPFLRGCVITDLHLHRGGSHQGHAQTRCCVVQLKSLLKRKQGNQVLSLKNKLNLLVTYYAFVRKEGCKG